MTSFTTFRNMLWPQTSATVTKSKTYVYGPASRQILDIVINRGCFQIPDYFNPAYRGQFVGSVASNRDAEGVTIYLDSFYPVTTNSGSTLQYSVDCQIKTALRNAIFDRLPMITPAFIEKSIQGVRTGLNSRCDLSLNALFATSATASFQNNRDVSSAKLMNLQFHCLALSDDFEAESRETIPFVSTALSRHLTTMDGASKSQTGFLTLDSVSSELMLLIASDPKCRILPLVGVWVSGAPSVAHPLVWAACCRFVHSCRLASEHDQDFLIVLYNQSQHCPEFYECRRILPTGTEEPCPSFVLYRGDISVQLPCSQRKDIRLELTITNDSLIAENIVNITRSIFGEADSRRSFDDTLTNGTPEPLPEPLPFAKHNQTTPMILRPSVPELSLVFNDKFYAEAKTPLRAAGSDPPSPKTQKDRQQRPKTPILNLKSADDEHKRRVDSSMNNLETTLISEFRNGCSVELLELRQGPSQSDSLHPSRDESSGDPVYDLLRAQDDELRTLQTQIRQLLENGEVMVAAPPVTSERERISVGTMTSLFQNEKRAAEYNPDYWFGQPRLEAPLTQANTREWLRCPNSQFSCYENCAAQNDTCDTRNSLSTLASKDIHVEETVLSEYSAKGVSMQDYQGSSIHNVAKSTVDPCPDFQNCSSSLLLGESASFCRGKTPPAKGETVDEGAFMSPEFYDRLLRQIESVLSSQEKLHKTDARCSGNRSGVDSIASDVIPVYNQSVSEADPGFVHGDDTSLMKLPLDFASFLQQPSLKLTSAQQSILLPGLNYASLCLQEPTSDSSLVFNSMANKYLKRH